MNPFLLAAVLSAAGTAVCFGVAYRAQTLADLYRAGAVAAQAEWHRDEMDRRAHVADRYQTVYRAARTGYQLGIAATAVTSALYILTATVLTL